MQMWLSAAESAHGIFLLQRLTMARMYHTFSVMRSCEDSQAVWMNTAAASIALALAPLHAGSQRDSVMSSKRSAQPLSHSISFTKIPKSKGSALPVPAAYSGRHAKQGSSHSLRHSTGSLKATLRRAAQSHAEPAGHLHAKQAQHASREAKPSATAAELAGHGRAAKRAQQAQGLSKAKAAPAIAAADAPRLAVQTTVPNRVGTTQPGHVQAVEKPQPVQHAPSRLAADPGAANDLASNSDGGSQASVGVGSSPWSSKSPHGQLNALQRMLQALPERGTNRGGLEHDQVCPRCKSCSSRVRLTLKRGKCLVRQHQPVLRLGYTWCMS